MVVVSAPRRSADRARHSGRAHAARFARGRSTVLGGIHSQLAPSSAQRPGSSARVTMRAGGAATAVTIESLPPRVVPPGTVQGRPSGVVTEADPSDGAWLGPVLPASAQARPTQLLGDVAHGRVVRVLTPANLVSTCHRRLTDHGSGSAPRRSADRARHSGRAHAARFERGVAPYRAVSTPNQHHRAPSGPAAARG